ELAAARHRPALALGAPEDRLLLGELHAVPALDDHADAARHEVAAPDQPLGTLLTRHPDVLGHGIRLLGLDVGGAVFEAEQVAGRGLARRGRRGATEAELRPAQHGAP